MILNDIDPLFVRKELAGTTFNFFSEEDEEMLRAITDL